VLDADKGYSFIKRISYDLPAARMPAPKVSGIEVSVPLQMLYVATNGWLMGIDLKTDRPVWTFNGESAPVSRTREPRAAVASARGRCPTASRCWSDQATTAGGINIDSATGKVLGKLDTPDTPGRAQPRAHGGRQSRVPWFDVESEGGQGWTRDHRRARAQGDEVHHLLEMVRPLTINHDGSLVYVNVNDLIGFEIGDTQTGKMIKRVELPGGAWKGKGYSHGIGMTPDESEIWVADPVNGVWQVWDNPGDGRNPSTTRPRSSSRRRASSTRWVSMTNDGKLAFLGDSSVIDVKTHKEIAVMKDEFGRRIVHTEKLLYLTFRDGQLIETNNQFAIGNAKAYAARQTSTQN
jgi:hypothetical protein